MLRETYIILKTGLKYKFIYFNWRLITLKKKRFDNIVDLQNNDLIYPFQAPGGA